MKIAIPRPAKINLSLLANLFVEGFNSAEEKILSEQIAKDVVAVSEYVEVPTDTYEQCDKIQFRIEHIGGEASLVKFHNKAQALYKSKMQKLANVTMRYKQSPLFEDTDTGRKLCLQELDKKMLEAASLPATGTGSKNLIYYAVYFDTGYVDLLNKSVMSIMEKSGAPFDLLIITDEPTKELILRQPFTERLYPKFLITETPFDGVDASKAKTKIFDYEHIDLYNNVLFLDCDIVCVSNIKSIFDCAVDHDTLYTARHSHINYGFHKSYHFGFSILDDDYVKEMRIAGQLPFNAGQFLFKVSPRMRRHFENLNWFMDNWAGEYFFEQAFMCYYFCKAYLTDEDILQKRVSIISTTVKADYNITEDICLVHFTAPPMDAKTKIAFIEKFLKEFTMQDIQPSS